MSACGGGSGRRCVVQVSPVTMSGEYPAVVRGATAVNLDDAGPSLQGDLYWCPGPGNLPS